MKRTDAGDTNPCLKEQDLTYTCFSKNNYDKEKCSLEIENYKTCKGFWHAVQVERRKKGIRPFMPLPDERAKIKKEFFEKVHDHINS